MQEEEQLGKAFDTKLMRRLLAFAKPYRWLIFASILVMMVSTSANLTRPYLIELAIDKHMSALTQPMVIYSVSSVPSGVPAATYHHERYVRTGLLSQSQLENARNGHRSMAQLVNSNGAWYLVESRPVDFPLSPKAVVNTEANGMPYVNVASGHSASAVPLSQSAIQAFQAQDVTGVTHLGLLYLSVIVMAFFLNFLQTYLIGYAVQKTTVDLRMKLFTHLQKLSLAFFDKNPVGRLVTRVMNDVQTINDMLSTVLLSFFQDIFTIIGIVFVLIQMNVSLASISFVAIPLVLLSTVIYRRFARDAFRQVRVKLSKINAALAEYISGMRIIHIFQQQNQIYDRFKSTNHDYLKSSMRELFTFAVFRPSMDFIYTLTVAGLLWYGGLHVLSGALQFGVLYAFISYVQQFFQPINDLAEKYNVVQQAMASSERMFELLDSEEMIQECRDSHLPASRLGKVEFRNVWFAYVGEEWVLRDVNFTIHPGQTVAFVGATGAGKSSILSLISRFYDVQKGEILVDGVDVREWPLDALRKRVGVVMQDVFLFSGTIADNIRLGNENISDDTILEVVRYVNAKPFIDRLAGGISHQVQERGATFSAGERQLIAFARTLAFDPDILVLDEATSNIDTETEQFIQDALVKLTQNRTTIVVAHRLSTIQHADNIIVLHKGRVRESGSHQELLALRGMYWNLYQLQYKDQESPTLECS